MSSRRVLRSDPKSVLIIGAGSISYKHARAAKSLFPACRVIQVSASGRQLDRLEFIDSVEKSTSHAFKNHTIDLVIIATPAISHLHFLEEVFGEKRGIPVLVEKPLAASYLPAKKMLDWSSLQENFVRVAYCLRHHSGLQQLQKMLKSNSYGSVKTVHAEVAQHLQYWRPEKDYRNTVTAKKSLGGGVLLELSHELDYLESLFGELHLTHAVVSNTATLDIDVEDVANLFLRSKEEIPITLHLNLLQRPPSRYCRVQTNKHTIVFDWNSNQISIDGRVSWGGDVDEIANIYAVQLKKFWNYSANSENCSDDLATVESSLRVLKLIDQAKGLPVEL